MDEQVKVGGVVGRWRSVVGLVLIGVGGLIFLETILKTGWLLAMAVPVAGLLLTVAGWRMRKIGLLIAGALILGFGGGGYLAFGVLDLSLLQQIGVTLMGGALAWVLVAFLSRWAYGRFLWWPLLPALGIGGLAGCFLFSPAGILDFVLYLGVAIGLALLLPGLFYRLLGLIIPGCLLVSIGPGIYLGWAIEGRTNGLTNTGIMLVFFGLGWGLITLCSRVVTEKFVWWPLIPGGVLAVTGWGLYIGGDTSSALSFIGNTGSIGLMMLGLYLVLMRRGMRR
jgi:hypothetical protein